MTNPFRPGAANPPTFLAGRESQEKIFRATLRSAPEIPANLAITGLRGVGKSVLLTKFAELSEGGLSWSVAKEQITPRHNSDSALTALVAGLVRQSTMKLSRLKAAKAHALDLGESIMGLLKITTHDITFSLSSETDANETSLTEMLLTATQESLRAGKNGFILMLDEAQIITDDKDRRGEHPLSLLVAAVNTLQSAGLPIALVLCGLPTLKTNLLKARTYSERMFRGIPVDRLTKTETREAFLVPLHAGGLEADEELITAVLEDVDGYPYFIQLWGASLWDEAQDSGLTRLTVSVLNSIREEIHQRLDHDFFDPRVESLTPAEQDLITLTADCPYPPLKTTDIHARTSRNQGNVNVLMGRLAEQGIVYRIQKGQYSYTAPNFHEYLQRRRSRHLWR